MAAIAGTTAHKSQLIKSEAMTAGVIGSKYQKLGFNRESIHEANIKRIALKKMLMRKYQWKFCEGVIRDVAHITNPVSGGYSTDSFPDEYGQVFVSICLAPYSALISE